MSAPRKTIATFGPKGATVRVVLHDATTVRAEWYEGPKGHKRRRVKEWPNTTAGKIDAKAWAKGFSNQRTLPKKAEQVSLRTLWERYATAEFDHLRPRTQALYAVHWRYWERMWGRHFVAESTTLEMVDEFRAALTKKGLSVSLIGKTITTVKQLYRWGHMRKHLPANPIGDYRYKVAKDKRPKAVPEYSDAEFRAILAQLDPEDGRQWRAFVGLSLCGWQGVRENAAVHLRWEDIDADTKTVTWQARYDKMGRTWTQPLREPTLAALAAAWAWRERVGYAGPWVIPANNPRSKRDGSYSPQSLIASLRTAEKRAKVPYLKGRGPHGMRRLLSGEVAYATGNALLAMRAIGDTDARQVNRYILERDDEVRAAFEAVDRRRNPGSHDGHRHPTATSAENDTSAPEGRSLETIGITEDTANEH